MQNEHSWPSLLRWLVAWLVLKVVAVVAAVTVAVGAVTVVAVATPARAQVVEDSQAHQRPGLDRHRQYQRQHQERKRQFKQRQQERRKQLQQLQRLRDRLIPRPVMSDQRVLTAAWVRATTTTTAFSRA